MLESAKNSLSVTNALAYYGFFIASAIGGFVAGFERSSWIYFSFQHFVAKKTF